VTRSPVSGSFGNRRSNNASRYAPVQSPCRVNTVNAQKVWQ